MRKFLLLLFLPGACAHAQLLQVDSVCVDSVWNSDSSWYDNQGNPQQRYSRDLNLSFKPMGGGMAQCFVSITIDSGEAWMPSWDSVSVLDSGISLPVPCGIAGRVRLRVLGQDRPGVAFRVTARQMAPVLAGNPPQVPLGLFAALVPGAPCSVNLQCSQNNLSQGLSFSNIVKVWWDEFGDGTWNDSTATLSFTWPTSVPSGASGQRRMTIAKARDANGLWSAPCTLTVQFGLVRLMTMESIAGGTFLMGSANTELGASPADSVTLAPFSIMQTLVTQDQYQAVMGIHRSFFDTGSSALLRPVEEVTWYDAVLFCNAVSKATGYDTVYRYSGKPGASVVIDYTKNGYRLPTEAEYEYACRAGTTSDYYWGRNWPPVTLSDTLTIDSNAVWYYTSGGSTQPVAGRLPNAWGLYDMSGNVLSWCNDWWADYQPGSSTDPTGPAGGSYRVERGGSWNYDYALNLCAADRTAGNPSDGYNVVGFRIVRNGR